MTDARPIRVLLYEPAESSRDRLLGLSIDILQSMNYSELADVGSLHFVFPDLWSRIRVLEVLGIALIAIP